MVNNSPLLRMSLFMVVNGFYEGDLHSLTGREPTRLALKPDRDRVNGRRFARDTEHVIGDIDMERSAGGSAPGS